MSLYPMNPRMQLAGRSIAIGLLFLVNACTEKTKDDPDRRPGPPQSEMRTNVREGDASGRGLSPATGPAMTIDAAPLASIEEVFAVPDQASLIGRSVRFTSVPVQQVLNSQYVIVGSTSDHSVVVRLKDLLPQLQPGQRLNITGMIAQLGADLAHCELDPDKKEIVRRYPIFVNAVISEPSTAP